MIEVAEQSIGQDSRFAVLSELGLSTRDGSTTRFLGVRSHFRASHGCRAHSIGRTL